MANTRFAFRVLVVALTAVLIGEGCGKVSGRSVSLLGSTVDPTLCGGPGGAVHEEEPGHFVEVQGGGSTAGLQAVANGLADIGMCSRELTAEETRQFTRILVARDGLAIVVNAGNRVARLSIEEIRALFAGRLNNWQEVGGQDGPVRPITREEGSGTRESFVRLVMARNAFLGAP